MEPESKRLVVSVLACAAALAIGGLVGWSSRPGVTPPAATTGDTVVQPTIQVHVAGLVAVPGVVTLPEGANVSDAVQAAGGLLASADPDAVNLAAPVSAGQQVIVPGRGVGGPTATGGSGDGLVSLNSASSSQLEELPGVGPVLAERIIAHRDTNGPFSDVEELLQVPGIGEAKFASIRDLVRP